MKIKGFCTHCGKTRTYEVGEYEIDSELTCKFCNKYGNVIEK